MKLPVLEDLGPLEGKRVLVRSDLNVPLARQGDRYVIADYFRIEATLPTLTWLQNQGAEVSVCSHLGRPDGKVVDKYSMEPVRKALEESLPGVHVLENLRFDPREELGSMEFAKELADGYDYYVFDAFGVAHRHHSSVVGVPALLPTVAGENMALEVEKLSVLIESPQHPYIAVVGGAKVSDKLGLLKTLVHKVDHVIVGGAMAFTFLAAKGIEVGDSLVQGELVTECAGLLGTGKIILPNDFVCLEKGLPFGGADGKDVAKVFEGTVPQGWMGLDVGPRSASVFGEVLSDAKSIFWNGPMGVYEDPRFSKGTISVARSVAASSGYSVVGGGDSAAALRKEGLADGVSHLSTGGGASLEYLEKGSLPGIDALLGR